MGYLRKGMVINALREDMQDTKKCYEGYQERELIEFCYNCMEHVIDRLPQYYPENVVEETRWIPCSERLPEDNTDVIICFLQWRSNRNEIFGKWNFSRSL